MSAAGPPRGRLHERGEAQARSARPRVPMAADGGLIRSSHNGKEAARNYAPPGAANVVSVGVQ